ncbi:N-alpha-acetyltransferase 30-like [Phlebotomus papatasi]|uniref:N-alpha-acetyltransferase 30-like n=1 Tax=Phlebotomus papatasi TaxID=29031 RepID=UPI00248394F7|nr:N-alpha-acetyltransferase 30-like [Phlebotomus papatasi]
MEVQATKEADLTSNHTDGSKKKRPRRRNKSKSNEATSEPPPQTTMDIIRSSATMDELSQKLEERLNLKRNGIYNHRESLGQETAQNHTQEAPKAPSDSCSDRVVHEEVASSPVVNHHDQDDSRETDTHVPDVPTVDAPCCDTEPPAGAAAAEEPVDSTLPIIEYEEYKSELQMPDIMRLIQKDLSEPYSIYTYRYFIHNWPKLCFLAMHGDRCVGAIVCKLGLHRQTIKRGYIAMLAVDKDYRKMKIGTRLVQKAIMAMLNDKADEVVLETEITNTPALRLYENLGFVRDKRLFHYYLSGVDALRLKLWFR